MSLLSEFKEFAVKGNAFELAVGVIIGGAFGKIVNSIVTDLVMPFVSLFTGGIDFSNLYLVLGTIPEGLDNNLATLRETGVAVFAYGSFITEALQFVVLAFVVFLLVKYINRLKRDAQPPEETAAKAEDIQLLAEIRDLLKTK